jgi:hypothetical protein
MGLDRGQERRLGGSGVDSMMLQRLQGGLNNGTGSKEVDDDMGSAMGVHHVIWTVANRNHSGNGHITSSARCYYDPHKERA